jgi:hypothetical protein
VSTFPFSKTYLSNSLKAVLTEAPVPDNVF